VRSFDLVKKTQRTREIGRGDGGLLGFPMAVMKLYRTWRAAAVDVELTGVLAGMPRKKKALAFL
jgi:hypothetical protein